MTSRRQNENTTTVLNRRVGGSIHPHSLLSKKTAVNENSVIKGKTPSARAPIGKTSSNLLLGSGGKSKVPDVGKASATGEGTKPSTTQRAPLASKADPMPRPILGAKTNSSNKSTILPPTSIKTVKSKSKSTVPSHVVGSGTPTLSRSRVGAGASTPKTSRSIKKALNVYTPATVSAAPSRLRSIDVDEDDNKVEYMPPAVREMAYEPACLMHNEKNKNDSLPPSPTSTSNMKQSKPVMDMDFNFEMQDDNLQRSGIDLDSSLKFDVPEVDDFLFDI